MKAALTIAQWHTECRRGPGLRESLPATKVVAPCAYRGCPSQLLAPPAQAQPESSTAGTSQDPGHAPCPLMQVQVLDSTTQPQLAALAQHVH